MPQEEVFQVVMNVLDPDRSFIYATNVQRYPKGTPIFRVRKLKKMVVPIEELTKESDFWEPPTQFITKRGRLNKEGESLLYVAPGDPNTAINELKLVDGDFYALIVYEAMNDIKTNIICGEYSDYSVIGLHDEKAIMNYELINDFLRDEFSRDVGEGTEFLYRISEEIAKSYFDLPPEDVQDAWGYSSVQDKSKYNLCFRPEIAHKLLKLRGAWLCRKDNTDNIIIERIAIYSEADNHVEYYPVGSKEQKEYFPEIVIPES